MSVLHVCGCDGKNLTRNLGGVRNWSMKMNLRY